uniref:CASP-like protein n=1 Tax=Oryza brachyantha TaxID=4533 RepID=J3LQ57_ORYBR
MEPKVPGVLQRGLCTAYSLASALYIAVPRPTTLSRSWIVFLLDQARTSVAITFGSVACYILLSLGNKGFEIATFPR